MTGQRARLNHSSATADHCAVNGATATTNSIRGHGPHEAFDARLKAASTSPGAFRGI